MATSLNLPGHLTGLTESEVRQARAIHGENRQQQVLRSTWWRMLLEILQEPMLLLLIAVAVIYFLLHQYQEAWFMMAAIVIVSGISFYQDNRSRKALEALESLTTPLSRVIRDQMPIQILTTEIVPGDLVIAEEGTTINADGQIVYSHDFSVNESMLTGEAQAVLKSADSADALVYSGTIVSSGLVVYKVVKTGRSTRIGQLGSSIVEIREEPTPLQRQIEKFVRSMAILGIAVFLMVWLYHFIQSNQLLASLLKGLTLAMSVLPEEIPVAFTTFMALGSRKLMRSGIIVKKTRTVETLGSATVICADKTGTITENQMTLKGVYALANQTYYEEESSFDRQAMDVIEAAMWASEPIPFDPMEKTLHAVYTNKTADDERERFQMVHEYPLGGVPPMMTHVFQDASGVRIIAAKGAPEAILRHSHLSEKDREVLHQTIHTLAEKGYRILAVATAMWSEETYPETQQAFTFDVKGLVAFQDPPKTGIEKVFRQFYTAGIQVKIITGDSPVTTRAIARHAGIRHADRLIDGAELMALDPQQRQEEIREKVLFTRMFPEAKLAAVNALKENHEVVAMVGDGVNDGPALKAAHIGIAMGERGSEIAKSAAALILMHDDLSKMVDAIATGRRIYSNLKKAIQYIISIHIPIMLTVALPLFLGWTYPDIFTPVHVIFLELVMGPTCSIVYENEPMETNTMQLPPRPITDTFFNRRELGQSILQGIMITAGVLGIYQWTVWQGGGEELTRTMVFTTLIIANIFLTLVNRSFYYSMISTLRYKNQLLPAILGLTLVLLALMLYVPPVTRFFHLTSPGWADLLRCTLVAASSVLWIEIIKWTKRKKYHSSKAMI